MLQMRTRLRWINYKLLYDLHHFKALSLHAACQTSQQISFKSTLPSLCQDNHILNNPSCPVGRSTLEITAVRAIVGVYLTPGSAISHPGASQTPHYPSYGDRALRRFVQQRVRGERYAKRAGEASQCLAAIMGPVKTRPPHSRRVAPGNRN